MLSLAKFFQRDNYSEIKGAGKYEADVTFQFYTAKSMPSQSSVHILLEVFIPALLPWSAVDTNTSNTFVAPSPIPGKLFFVQVSPKQAFGALYFL